MARPVMTSPLPAPPDQGRIIVVGAGSGGPHHTGRAYVYDALTALGGRRFDIVYTGRGALCWLPDIPAWAKIVAGLVKPGGFLYLS